MGIMATSGNRAYVNRVRYSVSTSHHESILRSELESAGIPYYEVPSEVMDKLESDVESGKTIPDFMAYLDKDSNWSTLGYEDKSKRERDFELLSKEKRTSLVTENPKYVSTDILKKYPIIHRRNAPKMQLGESLKPPKKEQTMDEAISSFFKKKRLKA